MCDDVNIMIHAMFTQTSLSYSSHKTAYNLQRECQVEFDQTVFPCVSGFSQSLDFVNNDVCLYIIIICIDKKLM